MWNTRRLICAMALYVGSMLAVTGALSGQAVLFGRVVDATGVSIPTARVALLDSVGTVVKSADANDVGYFELQASAGRYTLRVSHNDFEPMIGDPFDIAGNERIGYQVYLTPLSESGGQRTALHFDTRPRTPFVNYPP